MNKVVQTFKYRTAYDIQLSKLNTQVNNQTQVWSHKKQLEKMKALKKKNKYFGTVVCCFLLLLRNCVILFEFRALLYQREGEDRMVMKCVEEGLPTINADILQNELVD